MKTLAIIAAVVLAAHPAIAQPKRSPAACVNVQEYEEMKKIRLDGFEIALQQMEIVRKTERDATLKAQHKMYDACMESGAEKTFCTRIALAPHMEQIRAECEEDGEDADACEMSAELPGR